MSDEQKLVTATKLLELLNGLGVRKAVLADELGIGRTTLFNWQSAVRSPESPTSPPTGEQLDVLGRRLLEELALQKQDFLSFLEDEAMSFSTRRQMLEGLLRIDRSAVTQMEGISGAWEEMDRDLELLVEKHGPEVLNRFAGLRGASGHRADKVPAGRGSESLGETRNEEEEAMIDIPPALIGKRYRYKYQAVFDVLLHATPESSASELAAQVRHLCPKGTFLPYRVGEDIGHILRGDGVYSDLARTLAPEQVEHLEKLRDNLSERGDLNR